MGWGGTGQDTWGGMGLAVYHSVLILIFPLSSEYPAAHSLHIVLFVQFFLCHLSFTLPVSLGFPLSFFPGCSLSGCTVLNTLVSFVVLSRCLVFLPGVFFVFGNNSLAEVLRICVCRWRVNTTSFKRTQA